MEGDAEKSTCFNEFFRSVFSPRISIAISSGPARRDVAAMEQIEVDQHGITVLLQALNESKAEGPDGLPSKMLKLCAQSVSPFLAVLFTKSLATRCLPADWKIAGVVPVHKSGPRDLVVNYRPISLTSVVCKTLEHILYTNIMRHLDSHSLLNASQHGFRQGVSCVTQLTEFLHEVSETVDSRSVIDCVFIDFKKAFDLVCHALLVHKMRSLNINEQVVNWVEEYLRLRSQFVTINGAQSDVVGVTSGVPQGPSLGLCSS